MIGLYSPRLSDAKGDWREYWHIAEPYQAVNTRDPGRNYWIANEYSIEKRRIFKKPTVKSDHVSPTNWSRITFHNLIPGRCFMRTTASGGWVFLRPYQYSLNLEYGSTDFWSNAASANGVKIKANINDESRLIAELMTKFVDSPLQLDATLAELDETANYLFKGVNNLAGGLIAVKTGARRRGKKLLKDARQACRRMIRSDNQSRIALGKRWLKRIPSTWKSSGGAARRYLEYKFALLPLVYDVSGLSQLMSEGLDPKGRYQPEPGLLSIGHAVVINSSQSLAASGYECEIEADLVYYARVSASIRNPELYAMARLGVVNPGLVVLERVPLSWLVEYVLPFGKFLSSLTSTLGLQFESGYKGISLLAICRSSFTPPGQPKGTLTQSVVQGFERNVLSDFPRALPYVKSPFTIKESQFYNVLAITRLFLGR